MCARIFYLILGAMVLFNIVTIAAFIYLEWWQAILVSIATVFLLVYAGKLLIRRFFRNLFHITEEVLADQAKVLKGAQVSVHYVRPTEMPQEARDLLDEVDEDMNEYDQEENARKLEQLVWREFEISIFPDTAMLQPGDNPSWNPISLSLVPETWKFEDDFDLDGADQDDDGSIAIYDLQIVTSSGTAQESPEEVQGVQRLRFVAGVPTHLSEVSLAYFTEKFGKISLPGALPPRSA